MADTTEPAVQAGIRPRRADSRGRALTYAAPFKWRPLTIVVALACPGGISSGFARDSAEHGDLAGFAGWRGFGTPS